MSAKRIVSLAPSNTEILFTLGLGDEIVGVTEFCNHPQEASQKKTVGGFSTVDVDKVISLQPDLVLATDFHLETIVPELKSQGLNVCTVEMNTLLESPRAIEYVGKITGLESEASELARTLEEQISAVIEQVGHINNQERPKVCYLCCDTPLRFARNTCAPTKLIHTVGGVNIGRDIPVDTAVDLDTIVETGPDVIITSKGHGETTDLLSYVMNEPLLRDTPACRNGRVYQISSDLICRPGPRAAIGLRELAGYVHPEIFGNQGGQAE